MEDDGGTIKEEEANTIAENREEDPKEQAMESPATLDIDSKPEEDSFELNEASVPKFRS